MCGLLESILYCSLRCKIWELEAPLSLALGGCLRRAPACLTLGANLPFSMATIAGSQRGRSLVYIYMYIYMGNGTSRANLVGGWCSMMVQPAPCSITVGMLGKLGSNQSY